MIFMIVIFFNDSAKMQRTKIAVLLFAICQAYIAQHMDRFCNESKIGEQVDHADASDVRENNTTNSFHQ